MVDLVKIRKKAKEQKATQVDDRESAASPGGESTGTEGVVPRPESKRSVAGKGKKPGKKRSPKSPKKATKKAAREAKGDEATAGTPKAADSGIDPAPAGKEDGTAPSAQAENKLSQFKRTAGVLQERDSEDSVAEEDAAGDLQLELITFNLAGEQYAMGVDRLVEIIVPRPWTRVPNAEESVIGIISLRGTIVTLIDLRRLLGHPGRGEESEDTRIIVVQGEGEQVGFIVDRVLRVVKVDESAVEPHPVVSSSEQHDAVKGVFLSGETITIYLDLDRISA